MEKVKSHYDAAQNESTLLTKQDFKNDPARAVAKSNGGSEILPPGWPRCIPRSWFREAEPVPKLNDTNAFRFRYEAQCNWSALAGSLQKGLPRRDGPAAKQLLAMKHAAPRGCAF